jgi:hypothetical protein
MIKNKIYLSSQAFISKNISFKVCKENKSKDLEQNID